MYMFIVNVIIKIMYKSYMINKKAYRFIRSLPCVPKMKPGAGVGN